MSSPYYPVRNGFTEKCVGIAEQILRKIDESKIELQLMLMEYRNTQISGTNIAPAQLLLRRICRTKLRIKDELLNPK